jgi:methylase of polypeptide subunit release factors
MTRTTVSHGISQGIGQRTLAGSALADPGPRRDACLRLLDLLEDAGYDFLAPTPASHARVVARPGRRRGDGLVDLLGWSLACPRESIPPSVLSALDEADLVTPAGEGTIRAAIRVSRLFDNLFIHSRYPTEEADAVFLGPDSHRFADFVLRNVDGLPQAPTILDYGAGAGAGGITAATRLPGSRLTLADVNPKALAVAAINAEHAGVHARTVRADAPTAVDGTFDLVVMHPPFMIDPARRTYRDGGDLHGGRLSVDWALAGLERLAPAGRLVMHTGASIVGGRDVVHDELRAALPPGYALAYRLLDPDIFGEELAGEAYAEVDRIAAVGLRIERARH